MTAKTLYFWLGVAFTWVAGSFAAGYYGHIGPLALSGAVSAFACWIVAAGPPNR